MTYIEYQNDRFRLKDKIRDAVAALESLAAEVPSPEMEEDILRFANELQVVIRTEALHVLKEMYEAEVR